MNYQLNLIFVLIVVLSINGCSQQSSKQMKEEKTTFDWQGHRGARGLLPENTVPAFLKALEFPAITTLEMDAAITKDSVVVISHEPWLSHDICSFPNGQPITREQEKKLNIYTMTYAELKTFNCGSRGNKNFPDQKPMAAYKPALAEVVEAVNAYCEKENRPRPFYNIEIKSRPAWDQQKTPEPAIFAKLLVEEIKKLGIEDYAFVQSFDVRSLQAVKELSDSIPTVLLVDNIDGVEGNLEKLGYTPRVYSPHYKLVNSEVVKKVHDRKMKLIPWTVNETADMNNLLDLGVDGIITDYPNRIPQ